MMQNNNKVNQYSANLSELFNGKSVKLISDPEGYSFAHLLGNRDEPPVLATDTAPLIVLGDLLDSAIALTASGNILTMGNLAELKAHNLDNLLQCRNNPNIHVMFGNRDLNKLKLLPLAKVKPHFSSMYQTAYDDLKAYLNPQQTTKNISYLELAKQLRANINNKNWEWEIPDLKHWYPFWKHYNNSSAAYTLWKAGRRSSPEQVMTCLERFFLIFGADNTDGTISAYNSLFCIPKEVMGAEFKSKFPKFADQVNNPTGINLKDYKAVIDACNEPANTGLKEELDLAAALVLTIYMRMFYPPHASSNNYLARGNEVTLKYDGLLYDFYTSPQTYFCAYANTTQPERLLTFSHGGITNNFLNSEYASGYDSFFDDVSNYNIMTTLSGGYYAAVTKGAGKTLITGTISTFNTTYKNELVKVIHNYLYSKNYDKHNNNTKITKHNNNTKITINNWVWNKNKKPTATKTPTTDYRKPTKSLLKFMAMTAPFNSCLHKGLTDCTKTETEQIPHVNSENYSPIIPGILGLRKPENALYCDDANLVQFIGHSPQGFGATIDLFTSTKTDNSHKTYNVNLDISNTALSHNIISDLNKLSDNYFYMVYDTGGKLTTHGKIHVNTTNNGDDNPFKQANLTNGEITYDSIYDILGSDFNAMLKFNQQTQNDSNMNYWEHGKLQTGNFLYTYSGTKTPHLFTYTPVLKQTINRGGFRKTKRQSIEKNRRSQTKKLKRK